MSKTHIIKQGDCISSLAVQDGFASDALWEHPDNSELRDKRRDANVLAPGDAVVIPDKKPATYTVQSGGTHCFRLVDKTVTLRLRLQLDDQPVRDAAYELEIDGTSYQGSTKVGQAQRGRAPDPPQASKPMNHPTTGNLFDSLAHWNRRTNGRYGECSASRTAPSRAIAVSLSPTTYCGRTSMPCPAVSR